MTLQFFIELGSKCIESGRLVESFCEVYLKFIRIHVILHKLELERTEKIIK